MATSTDVSVEQLRTIASEKEGMNPDKFDELFEESVERVSNIVDEEYRDVPEKQIAAVCVCGLARINQLGGPFEKRWKSFNQTANEMDIALLCKSAYPDISHEALSRLE